MRFPTGGSAPAWRAALDRALDATTNAVGVLALPLSLLLFLQWPLRELVQAYSREANDVARWTGPEPVSAMLIQTPSAPEPVWTVNTPPLLIACIAFLRRLTSTCLIWAGSRGALGSWRASLSSIVSPRFSISGRSSSMVSRAMSFNETSFFCGGVGRMACKNWVTM